MFKTGINQLGGIISDLMNNLANLLRNSVLGWLFDIINGIYGYVCRIIYSILIVPLATIIDICQLMFRKFAGLKDMTIEGQDTTGDIVIDLINSKTVQNIFWSMFILAFILLLVCTFVATIKTEFDAEGNNNKRKVIKNAFRGLANFVLVPIISVFGLIVSNGLLRTIDAATSSGSETLISTQIFTSCAYSGNRVRKGEDSEGLGYYVPNSFGALVVGADDGSQTGTSGGYANFGIFYDDVNGSNGYRAADKIDKTFSAGLKLDIASAGLQENQRSFNFDNSLSCINEFYNNGVYYMYPNNTFSLFSAAKWPGITDNAQFSGNNLVYTDHITFSIYNVGLVNYYYDLTLIGGFQYLIFIVVAIFCAWDFLLALIGLIKRLFMLVTLFIISPPICATYPLNNGETLKKWRGEFIKNALSAYSVVVVMNIFIALLPLLTKIEVFSPTDFASIGLGGSSISWKVGLLNTSMLGSVNYTFGAVTADIANNFARLLFIVGGLTFFKKCSKSISDIIGAGDAFNDGADTAKDLGKNVAKVAAGVALGGAGAAKIGGMIAKGQTNLIKKGYNGLNNKFNNIGKKPADPGKGPGDPGGKAVDPGTGGSGGPTGSGGGSGGGSTGSGGGSDAGGASGAAEASTKSSGSVAGFMFGNKGDHWLTHVNKTLTMPIRAIAKGGSAISSATHNAITKLKNSNFAKAVGAEGKAVYETAKSIATGKDLSVKDAFYTGRGDLDNRSKKKAKDKENANALAIQRKANDELLNGYKQIANTNAIATRATIAGTVLAAQESKKEAEAATKESKETDKTAEDATEAATTALKETAETKKRVKELEDKDTEKSKGKK